VKLLERGVPAAPGAPRVAPRRWRLPVHWPLSVALLGFPLWWALGLRTILPMALSLVMLDQLMRRRRIALPSGFALWALFLAWFALGIFVLFADAPGAVPGGDASRFLVFAYRAAWYATVTIALLWVTNLRESELPTRWLYQLLGYMFLVTAVGGLVGVLAPGIEFASPVELVLPRGLRDNGLVQAIVHPAVADIQNVLGRPQARPKAPFPFANSWGSSLALYLPFFLVAWFRHGARWQRYAAPFVLVLAAIPIVYSLNRGLWVVLALGAAGYVLLQVVKGRPAAILLSAGLVAIAVLAFVLSPLATIVQERLEHQHSNERRSQLTQQTLASTAEGSPVVGFGSTRDVQGSFASIAGGATPDCQACGVPPLGTQGHLWQVVFTQGFGGLVLFVSFFVVALARTWRCRTTTETLGLFVLGFFLTLMLVYDTLGMPLLTVMLTIGLLAREQRAAGGAATATFLHTALTRLRERWPILMVPVLVGVAVGAGLAAREPVQHATRVAIVLSPLPVSLAADEQADTTDATTEQETVTVDTEAALVVSRESLRRVTGTSTPSALDELRERIRVSAVPRTRVLTVEVRDTDAEKAEDEAVGVAESYLVTREGYLSSRRDQALATLRDQITELPASGTDPTPAGETRQRLEQAATDILLTPTTAGEIIRTRGPIALRRQVEVPVVSGAALGLAVGAVLMAAFPGWRPARRSRGARP
jgi:hypothetical protein